MFETPTSWIKRPSTNDEWSRWLIGHYREQLASALMAGRPHAMECATSISPAMEPGPCDCGSIAPSAEFSV